MIYIICLLLVIILNGLRKEILHKILALKALGFFAICPEKKLLKNLAQLSAEGPELLRCLGGRVETTVCYQRYTQRRVHSSC